jgi:ribosomal protein S18 acetylase RimI-like enzyme
MSQSQAFWSWVVCHYTCFEACWQTTLTARRIASILNLMTENDATLVRAFDGSLADAQGILTVERATFDESPYSAQQVQAMLTDGPQHAWLAFGGGGVVGFAIAFGTASLSGPRWELDLLAVHPRWRGRGLAARLIRAAAAGGSGIAGRARAVIATDNGASLHAFRHAGFRPAPETCMLLIYRPKAAGLRPRPVAAVRVREAASLADTAAWLEEFGKWAPPILVGEPSPKPLPDFSSADTTGFRPPTLLLAEKDGQPAGYAELVEVQTLLYRGAWIESLIAPARGVREALVEQTLGLGIAAGWDEMGAMVPESNWPLRNTLLAAGFRSLGDFRWLAADLPLSRSTSSPQNGGTEEGRPRPGHG